jgi:hypothetical protein
MALENLREPRLQESLRVISLDSLTVSVLAIGTPHRR